MKQQGHPRNYVRVRDPLLRELCVAIERSGMTDDEILDRSGYDRHVLRRIRSGMSCNLMTAQCLAGALGLELRLASAGEAAK